MGGPRLFFLTISIAVMGLSCSENRFSMDKAGTDSNQPQPANEGQGGEDPRYPGRGEPGPGLAFGHFDLDTSSKVYSPSDGETDRHIHEYDDKYDVRHVDFFYMLDSKLKEIHELIPEGIPFRIVVANAHLSRGGFLDINGRFQRAVDYQARVNSFLKGTTTALDTFVLGAAGPGQVQLTKFSLHFDEDAIVSGGLIPTQTGCVVKNDPGQKGEYRNGALTIQALAADRFALDPGTGVATKDGGLLWEATIFWHKEGAGCY
ncbi:MAG: hypothetical protein H6624_07985 [Bdellovibrionaceae bacterium]|nr:hypothetical protein [Bdellovibrionales bacterium]MCB9084271.1 hypothetical protein [Pseudobdellovibrionaceae bacterium]